MLCCREGCVCERGKRFHFHSSTFFPSRSPPLSFFILALRAAGSEIHVDLPLLGLEVKITVWYPTVQHAKGIRFIWLKWLVWFYDSFQTHDYKPRTQRSAQERFFLSINGLGHGATESPRVRWQQWHMRADETRWKQDLNWVYPCK